MPEFKCQMFSLIFVVWGHFNNRITFYAGFQIEEDRDRNSPSTSHNLETSDVEDDISVGDNRSDTSTPKKSFVFETTEYQKKDSDDIERSTPTEYNLTNRISNSTYNSPFKEDENEFENRNDERIKLYDTSLFHLYRPDRESNKDEANEKGSAFTHMAGSLSESIYGRSMDLTKSSFQSQLLAGFASVIVGNSQREAQESAGNSCKRVYL